MKYGQAIAQPRRQAKGSGLRERHNRGRIAP
ncbi:MAG: hypothetical protein ACI9MJ_001208 [Alphaproteobacteria bacterium]|jgi:hypothetical protein